MNWFASPRAEEVVAIPIAYRSVALPTLHTEHGVGCQAVQAALSNVRYLYSHLAISVIGRVVSRSSTKSHANCGEKCGGADSATRKFYIKSIHYSRSCVSSVSAIAAKIAAFNQSLKDCLLYQPHRQPH